MEANVAARVERILRGGDRAASPATDIAPSPFAPVVVPRTRAPLHVATASQPNDGVSPVVLWTALGIVMCSAIAAVAYVASRRLSKDAQNRARAGRSVVVDLAPRSTAVGEGPTGTPQPDLAGSAPETDDRTSAESDVDRRDAELAAEGEYTPLPA